MEDGKREGPRCTVGRRRSATSPASAHGFTRKREGFDSYLDRLTEGIQ